MLRIITLCIALVAINAQERNVVVTRTTTTEPVVVPVTTTTTTRPVAVVAVRTNACPND